MITTTCKMATASAIQAFCRHRERDADRGDWRCELIDVTMTV